MRILFAILCCAFLMSCGSDDGGETVDPEVVCPTVDLAGFEIRVINGTTSGPLSGVTITAREGNIFEEVLMEVSTIPGTYQGVLEREGSYVLVVELDGFQTVVTDAITVGRLDDECNTLDTQDLSFTLSEI
ncbi:hypothetical protein [uncultured Dokdonia sp.]|uniref:hypothetical protein n=1 Tax=uncultured Dokdonia sp. TaxID=575653 RepID=UPI00260CBBBC|nr:hypothetical protein [uncultured Dokdonia sp.]